MRTFLLAFICTLSLSYSPAQQSETGTNPFFTEYTTPFKTPPFQLIKFEHYMPAFMKGMEAQKKEIDAIVNDPEAPTFQNTIEAVERSGALLDKVNAVFGSLRGANTTDELQKIANEVTPLLSKHRDDINLNERLFQRVKRVYEQRKTARLYAEQLRLLENSYRDFVRGGANLSGARKERFRKINEEMSMLRLKFDENLLKETNNFKLVVDRKEDLAGLPQSAVDGAAEAAKRAKMGGTWTFTVQKPSMLPFLQYAENRALREKLFKGYIMRGDQGNQYDNKEIIAKIAALRVERARILGYKTHADFVLELNMAKNPKAAEKLAASGRIKYAPCHEHSAVGPMAGIISASMPVFIVKNEAAGNYAYATQNEGLGKVLRYGAYSPEVIERLKWMETALYPTLKAAIEFLGKVDLKAIVAQALHMGDEVHNRNRAGTSLFYRAIAPAVIRTAKDMETAAKVLEFINGNDHFFLNLSMALSKASLDAGRGVKDSSVAVVMARNGTDFGVQLSGTGEKWFTGPAPVPDALYFPGYTKADANPDIGDSAITETNGLGGFAIAAAPAIVQFVGGTAADAVSYTLAMYEITAGENNIYKIPYLNFRGTPTGIDVIKVAKSGILPFIDTGVAHKKAGIGQVGAGVLSAPPEPFAKAFEYFAKNLK